MVPGHARAQRPVSSPCARARTAVPLAAGAIEARRWGAGDLLQRKPILRCDRIQYEGHYAHDVLGAACGEGLRPQRVYVAQASCAFAQKTAGLVAPCDDVRSDIAR